MNAIPETCPFYSTKHKPMSLISKVYIYFDYKWFTVFLTKTPSFLYSQLNVIGTSTILLLFRKKLAWSVIQTPKVSVSGISCLAQQKMRQLRTNSCRTNLTY